jgi:hypothetical protein
MLALFLAIGLFSPPTSQPTSPPTSQPTSMPASHLQGTRPNTMGDAAVAHRGAPFALAGAAISLDEVVAAPDQFAGKAIKVSGTIGTVCQAKGCWMSLAGTRPGATARVTFKDYAFFAPKDAKGAQATLEGTIEVKHLSEGERAHLAEDARASIDTVPKVELRLQATALEVRRAP